ncbi:hypothetical protein [Pseudolysinimonas sp.]|jgi:hypothetical protein|uniref:hypothetical protein n=1 Tax=Pseudolysinimonas sp. TaxID=2680009 RepID=UPI00378336A3
MTTYQDPPLQSRRASRQGERPEAQPSSPFAPPQVPRTAAGAGEPLSYVTQNRPPLPGYDSAPPRGRRASDAGAPDPVASPTVAEAPSAQSFRPRDYSPEARSAPPAWAPEHDRGNGVLDHHTQARAAVVPPVGGSLAAALASEPTEHTLSRRELRAIRDASQIAPDPAPTTPVTAQQAPMPVAAPQAPAPAPSTQLDSAMAEFDALSGRSGAPAGSRRAGRRAAPQSDVAPEDGLGVFEPTYSAPAVVPVPQAAPQPAPVVLPPQPAPMAPAQFQPAPLPPQAAPVAPVPPMPVSAPITGERPVGHWTNQSDLDDAVQVAGSTTSRTVGSAAITTSALVLPSIPGHDMSTGEVMLTGSISLPSSLASTGAHHSIDESDIDHLLDPGDHQLVNTDSVPIRAIRAVSSHTSTRGVIATSQPKKAGRALTALIISASVMVVVVVTLLVVALATEVI